MGLLLFTVIVDVDIEVFYRTRASGASGTVTGITSIRSVERASELDHFVVIRTDADIVHVQSVVGSADAHPLVIRRAVKVVIRLSRNGFERETQDLLEARADELMQMLQVDAGLVQPQKTQRELQFPLLGLFRLSALPPQQQRLQPSLGFEILDVPADVVDEVGDVDLNQRLLTEIHCRCHVAAVDVLLLLQRGEERLAQAFAVERFDDGAVLRQRLHRPRRPSVGGDRVRALLTLLSAVPRCVFLEGVITTDALLVCETFSQYIVGQLRQRAVEHVHRKRHGCVARRYCISRARHRRRRSSRAQSIRTVINLINSNRSFSFLEFL